VNTVAPGFIETDMTQSLTDEQQALMLERIPLGRIGAVDEVAGAVAYLISDEAGYMTAQTLHINGGMYAA
jgi:3-oxoacyl-[acyl-carrier protein] reductase